MQRPTRNERDWSRAYYTVFALAVLLIPATTYVGVRYAVGTVMVAEAWGWGSSDLPGVHLQAYYRLGWVGYSLFGIVPLLVIAALSFRRTRGWSTCVSAILLASSVLFYLRGILHCAWMLHCVAQGTLIATPLGDVPVEALHVGDSVWTMTEEGVLGVGEVQAIASFSVGSYLEITGDDGSTLRVTGTQPVATTESWTLASRLEPGDRLRTMESTVGVASVTRISQPVTAYDLTVEPGHSFFAGGVLVHNKILSLTAGGESPFNDDLVRAVQFNDPAGVQAALDAGADPNAGAGHRLVLHIAVDDANVEICRILIDAGADLTRVDADGRTPLMVAMTRPKRPSAEWWDEQERQNRQEILSMLEAADPAGERAIRGLRRAIDAYYAVAREEEKEGRDTPKEAVRDAQ